MNSINKTVTLNNYDSLFLLTTKNWQYNEKVEEKLKKYYKYSELDIFDGISEYGRFIENIEESILNKYPEVVNVFSFIIGISFEYIQLVNINNYMIKILEKIYINEPKELNIIYKRLIEAISSHRYIQSTGYALNKELKLKYSPTQSIFLELYSILSLIQVKENNKELFKLNVEYIKNDG